MPELEIGASRPVREEELVFRYTRSGGPGGQHVNTSSTRVELVFDVSASPALTDAERTLAKRRLRTRLDSEGRLRVVAQDERSRARNRAIAVERFCDLMREALRPPPPPRRRTRPTRAATEERLETKRRAGRRKRLRRPPAGTDE
ncbi:MAG TPA: alternative ribosome rescue aminoacyl-tRNA hydrolase ArfB [Gaiellales bacterium]|nr:alternative ribosome rescue aminoacyl-tRNA hydrolase ArfB [Gaiellales bacterium]